MLNVLVNWWIQLFSLVYSTADCCCRRFSTILFHGPVSLRAIFGREGHAVLTLWQGQFAAERGIPATADIFACIPY